MLAFKQVNNNARSTITVNDTTNPKTASVAAGHGARFPAPGNGFWTTIWDSGTYSDPGDDPNMEIVLVTARSTDSLTFNRGQLGTVAVAHGASAVAIRLLIVDQAVEDIHQGILDTKVASWMGV